MGNTEEEKDWISRSQEGDPAAFEALIRAHQTMIHSLTYRMTGSVADCKDLAQETFIRAYQQLDSYQSTAKFSSWLYRIAINLCLDWQRREKRRGLRYASWSDSINEIPSRAEESSADDEVSRQVRSALLKLPDKQRAAIVLTIYGDHTHGDAAKILGCSETTVSWRIFAAKRKLKQLLSVRGEST